MGTDPIIKQGETSTNVNMGADNPQDNTGHHSGSTAQPIPIQGQNSAQQTPQMAASHEQPYSLWRRVKSAATSTDDYFDHDNKVYQKKDGKTFLVTGAPEGDVELDADQTAKLDQARADKAGQDQKVKDAMATQEIVTEGFAPSEEGQRIPKTNPSASNPIKEFAEGYVNHGGLSDAQMYNASLAKQAGRLTEEAVSGFSAPNLHSAQQILSEKGIGTPMSSSEKMLLSQAVTLGPNPVTYGLGAQALLDRIPFQNLSDEEKWTLLKTGANLWGSAAEKFGGAKLAKWGWGKVAGAMRSLK